MRAMILAAGLGTRLSPITKKIPKPLLPVVGVPNIVLIIKRLRAVGIEQIVINTHWLSDVLKERLGDGSAFGVSIQYSDEKELLGTGGGIRHALPLLGEDTFVVVNGDALFAPDLKKAIDYHRRSGALATLIVREDPNVNTYGAVGVDPDGRIRRLVYGGVDRPILKNYMFTGVHILAPEAAKRLPRVGCVVQHTYIPMVNQGEPIFALPSAGYFCDLGTPERYLNANIDLVRGDEHVDGISVTSNGVFIGRDTYVDPRATVGTGTVLCQGAEIRGQVVVECSVILEGASVIKDLCGAIATSDGNIVPPHTEFC